MVQESMVTMESFSLSLVAVGSAAAVVYLCVAAWVSWPRRVGETFRRQGIDGPPPSSFLMGNLSEMQARVQQAVAAEEDGAAGGLHKDDGFDDYCKRIFPYFDKWRKAYGMSFVPARPSVHLCFYLVLLSGLASSGSRALSCLLLGTAPVVFMCVLV
uniref:Secologanin synthase n=1 Tax=Aegilops tauschii subsp. strangulata TaxID=200361 RepID=A0A452ZD15_AEGTS